jgi:transcriptional regulator with XRE-family HTH domain
MDVQLTPRSVAKPGRFPNEIRRYRLQAGLSQKKLGKLVGKGRNLISTWERGHSLPTLKNAIRLATALGTLVESLFYDLYSASKQPDPNAKEA